MLFSKCQFESDPKVSGFLLWESCCVSSLLHNSGSWVGLSGQAEQWLESLQLWFLRLLLRQGLGAASGSLLWETKTLSMKLRIWREKLSLALHIVRLPYDSLAKKIWEEQKLYGWRAWWQRSRRYQRS